MILASVRDTHDLRSGLGDLVWDTHDLAWPRFGTPMILGLWASVWGTHDLERPIRDDYRGRSLMAPVTSRDTPISLA